jgi:hypothetical protein
MFLEKRQHDCVEFLMESHSIEPRLILAKRRVFRCEFR